MQVTKGLIIADPWIGYILDGIKTWEMRSSETSVRGPFALIRKGTGAIWGVATLSNIGWRMSPEHMLETLHLHRIPAEMIRSGEVAKWNVPWILTDVRRLELPVPYNHPSGAVTWVNLDESVTRAVGAQLFGDSDAGLVLPAAGLGKKAGSERQESPDTSRDGGLIVQTRLTDGNIRNNHFYLRGYLHRFPSGLVGGSNKAAKAEKQATLDWGGPTPVVTDIDGEKQFFRARGWIKQFFELTGARAGDWVLVEEAGSYRYRVSLKRS